MLKTVLCLNESFEKNRTHTAGKVQDMFTKALSQIENVFRINL